MKGRNVVGVLVAVGLAVGMMACQKDGGHASHIPVENTPPAVMDGFHREFPGCTLSHTDEIRLPDGTTNYELKFRDVEHHYHRKVFSASGQLLDSRENVAIKH